LLEGHAISRATAAFSGLDPTWIVCS